MAADLVDPGALNLGSANGRLFAFNVGVGFDAAVVREVDGDCVGESERVQLGSVPRAVTVGVA